MTDHGETIIPFGKHKGRTIDDIAGDNDGLRYLDWLRGQDWLFRDIREALDGYLDDPAIARELDDALDDD
jgi:uncharacterized protein (DUF3820 family)